MSLFLRNSIPKPKTCRIALIKRKLTGSNQTTQVSCFYVIGTEVNIDHESSSLDWSNNNELDSIWQEAQYQHMSFSIPRRRNTRMFLHAVFVVQV